MRKKYKKWTDELLRNEAMKYKTRGEFQKGSSSAYRLCLRREILDDVCSHMGGNVKWTDKMIRNEAMKYKTRMEFYQGSTNAYNTALRREILDDVCSHMEFVNTYWTDEMLRDEALKYKTRWEFQKGSESAYRLCLRREILDDVCSHMEGTPYVKWTDEMIRDEALKFKTRNEFKKESESAYNVALKREILDDVCKHMGRLPHQDKPHCVYLIEIFTTNNELYYYVGQTSNLARRLYDHFRVKGSNTTVFDFLNNTTIKYKKHYIVKNNISYKESLSLEKDTIKDLKNRGVRVLNKELI